MSSLRDDQLGTCPPVLVLKKFVEEELPSEERSGIDDHISSCPHCQQQLHQLVHSEPGPLGPLISPRCRPDTDSMDQEPRLDGYEPLSRIDAGGMGVVWRVRDLHFQRTLAVKVLKARACDDPNAVRRFLAEAQITGQLAHPFIVPIHAMGWLADKRPYYTMKLVEGKTLAELLRDRPDPTARRMELVQVFGQVCQAVAFAHSRGILHRDLKPANVMVGAHGEVQVMDWGLAKALVGTAAPQPEVVDANETADDARHETSEHTRTGSVLGTWAYMPPEQARGLVGEVDRRSDVFGLGAILCEVLTGEPPYTGPDARAVRLEATEARLDGALSRLRNCGADPELIRLAERCLAPAKADRPADAGEVAAAVAAYQAAVQERLQQERLERERQQVKVVEERRRRKLWMGLAAAVLALVLLGAGGGFVWQHQVAEEGRRYEREQQGTEANVEMAYTLMGQSRWKVAGDVLIHAENRLGPGAPEELRRTVERARDGLKWAERLDGIRLAKSTTDLQGEVLIKDRENTFIRGGFLKKERADREYEELLTQAGLGGLTHDPDAVAGRIRGSTIKTHWINALDDWAATTKDRRRMKWLLEVARRADTDEERNRLRDPDVWGDPKALHQVVSGMNLSKLSPHLLAALASQLSSKDGHAVALLQRAREHYPQDFFINLDLAKELREAQPEEAVAYYRAALAIRPDAAVAYNNLGVTYADMKKHDKAIEAYLQAIRADERYADAHTNLGIAYRHKGENGKAVSAHLRALEIDPQLASAHHNLSIAYLDGKEYDKARGAVQRAIEIQPHYAAAHTHLGNIYAEKKQYEKAINAHLEALKVDPHYALAYYNLGVTYAENQQPEEAIGAYQSAIKFDPQFALAYSNLGNIYRNRGSPDKALEAYEKALEADRQCAEAYIGLGNLHTDSEEHDKAVAVYRKGLESGRHDATFYHNLGFAYIRMSQFDKAIEALLKAVEIDRQFAAAYLHLGIAYDGKREYEQAIDAYKRSLAIDQELPNAHATMALAYRNLGRFAEAHQETLKTLQFLPEKHPLRGFTLAKLKQCETFLGLEKKLPDYLLGRIEPKDANERLALAEVCLYLRQYAPAVRFYRGAFAAVPKFAEDLKERYRYNAARVALLAAAGRGANNDQMDDKARAELRQQAREWLRADLKAWSGLVDNADSKSRRDIRWKLTGWQKDPDLAAIRDTAADTQLPAGEREDCERLWAEVEKLLRKAQDKK